MHKKMEQLIVYPVLCFSILFYSKFNKKLYEEWVQVLLNFFFFHKKKKRTSKG